MQNNNNTSIEDTIKDKIDLISYYMLYIDATLEDKEYQYLGTMLQCLMQFIEEAKEIVEKHYHQKIIQDFSKE